MSETKPVEIELVPDATSLYIFFGGIAAGIAMPPFEFYRSAKIINENKIFIRDLAQRWYQDGLPGISNDIDSTADFIRTEIKKLNPQKIFFVGNSMGGFAAILFSTLIGQGDAIAFAPQTFISPSLKLKHFDLRWLKPIWRTYKVDSAKRRIWDLRPLLLERGGNQKISIFVSKDCRLDHVHARHLKDIAGVKVFEFNSVGHGVVRLLKETGQLPAIMAGNFNG
jgi:pimeloyl-ACP methyl ester carboxylesterase